LVVVLEELEAEYILDVGELVLLLPATLSEELDIITLWSSCCFARSFLGPGFIGEADHFPAKS